MGRRSAASELTNKVQATRLEAGLSQQELAERAGLTRQSVNAIEGERYTPNTVVSIRLARALGCRVEDLFTVSEFSPTLTLALPPAGRPAGTRVALGRVGERLVSHPLDGERGLAEGFQAADGVMLGPSAVTLFTPRDEVERTAFLVGCDPSLGILAVLVTRRARDARLVWIPGSSRDALDALRAGNAHVAGIHLRDARSGECNLAPARNALTDGGIVVAYAAWEQGFVVRRGNPKAIRGAGALAAQGVRLINREPGAGSRSLLDQMLKAEGVAPQVVEGYDHIVKSHMAVGRAVADGTADAGVALRAIAEALDLEFVPIADVKFDLLVANEHVAHPAVDTLLDVLQTGALRAELAALPGYDSSQTGAVRRRFAAAA